MKSKKKLYFVKKIHSDPKELTQLHTSYKKNITTLFLLECLWKFGKIKKFLKRN